MQEAHFAAPVIPCVCCTYATDIIEQPSTATQPETDFLDKFPTNPLAAPTGRPYCLQRSAPEG